MSLEEYKAKIDAYFDSIPDEELINNIKEFGIEAVIEKFIWEVVKP